MSQLWLVDFFARLFDDRGEGWYDQHDSLMSRENHERVWKDRDLVYAAINRCACGAGLAHAKDRGAFDGYWDCADILTGRAVPSGEPGSVTHTAKLPFVFYEVKSENQPSARGMTTRPGGTAGW